MGFFDRLFGGDDEDDSRRREAQYRENDARQASAYRDADGRYAPPPVQGQGYSPQSGQNLSEDEAAIERYRYLLRTAPPETIEQVHAEAFGKLTEPQRQQVLADLSSTLPVAERPASDDPQAMARAATRAEYSQPGFMERTFGNRSFEGRGEGRGGGFGGGGGFGSMLGASMLGTIGGYVIGSALVSSFMAPAFAGDQGGSGESGDGGDGGESGGDAGADAGADAGGGDFGGFGDMGGMSDFGGFDGF